MDQIDFIKINETCEDYLTNYKDNFYVQNLSFYFKKAKKLLDCPPLEKIIIKEKHIDLLEGIHLIYEYLDELKPELAEKFIIELKNGQVQINYTDEDIWLEEKISGCWCHNQNKKARRVEQINEEEICIHSIPLSLIDIDNKETVYSLLPLIVHEFFHSIITIDKNGAYETNITSTLTEMISIYFEQNFIQKMVQKGYEKENFLTTYCNRYNNTTDKKQLKSFLDQTFFLLKKKEEGVIDEVSYKTGNITCSKEYFESIGKQATKQLNNKTMSFNAHKMAPYLLGAPLAYYLSCSTDQHMPQKMLDFAEEINSIPLPQSLRKIDLTLFKLVEMNDKEIMNNMRQEISLTPKTVNNYQSKI